MYQQWMPPDEPRNARRDKFLLDTHLNPKSPMRLILAGQTELWKKLQLKAYTLIRQRIDVQSVLSHYDRSRPELIYANIWTMPGGEGISSRLRRLMPFISPFRYGQDNR